MANCVITSTTNAVRFTLNDQADKVARQLIIIPKADVHIEKDLAGGAWVFSSGAKMRLCTLMDPSVIKVDTVDGVEPTDVDDLITKIEALL